MIHLVIQASKYLQIILFMVYTFACFYVFRHKENEKSALHIYHIQRVLTYVIHFDAFFVLYITTKDSKIIGMYLLQTILLSMIYVSYRIFYDHASNLVLNNMCMLLAIGFIMLTRLSVDKAFRQFIFVCVGFILSLLIPLILSKISMFRKLIWIYFVVGVGALATVLAVGATSYGAKLSVSVAGISIQPSEFVKILFVFFLASLLQKKQTKKQVFITGMFAAVFVLLLVLSKDLGGAFLYYITFLVMIYVASKKLLYFGLGLGALGLAGALVYPLFHHVQTRVLAWKDPLSVIDNEGYQVSQSLFAIGTGGWFGLGLNQGLPKKIPVVDKDFIFSAIAEEMGGFFALCLIIVCLSCFFMIINISMKLKEPFKKLVAVGLGTLYATQVFLTIGGAIKFIPSTGVTLPLISYGGSSMLSTMFLFGIIQGLYIDNYMEKSNKRNGKEKKVNRES